MSGLKILAVLWQRERNATTAGGHFRRYILVDQALNDEGRIPVIPGAALRARYVYSETHYRRTVRDLICLCRKQSGSA